MSEITDLEICKRIAEIEGKKLEPSSHGSYYKVKSTIYPFNPLADDALCFQLMVKHGVEVIPAWDRVGINNGKITIANYNDSPSRAICLAIIEAHKEK